MSIVSRRAAGAWVLGLLFPAGALFAQTSSPFLPAAGQADVSVTYAYQQFQNYRGRDIEASLPDKLLQNSVLVNGDYGLSNRVAFDFWSGYTRSSLQSSVSDGAADTTLGLRFLVHQWEHVTLTGRTDAIIAGSYPLSSLGPFAAGLGANGFLGSLLVGVTGPRGMFLTLENGSKIYASPTPNYFFSAATIGQTVGKFYYLGGFEEDRALAGVAINDPGFVFADFNRLKGIEGDFLVGLGINEKNGLSYGFTYARWVHGADSGERDIYALTVGYHFGKRGPHL